MSLSTAIVLLHWRNTNQLTEVVRRVHSWSHHDVEVIVVDNDPSPDSSSLLKMEDERLHYVNAGKNLGFGAGCNLGVETARALGVENVLLLNCDARLDENNFGRLIDTLNDNNQIDFVSPVICEQRAGVEEFYVGAKDIAHHQITREKMSPEKLERLGDGEILETEYISGTAFLGRLKTFDTLGPLDAAYFFSGEIADYCRRARDAGFGLAVALKARVVHFSDETPGAVRNTLYYYYSLRNRFLFVRKHYPQKRIGLTVKWALVGIGFSLKNIIRMRFGAARAALLAVLHGTIGKFGFQNDRFV